MNNSLNPNDILMAEFNYAKETAIQANSDRIRFFEIFTANLITIVASVMLPYLNLQIDSKIFSVIFIALFAFGIITNAIILKTRIAWFNSLKAMNKIKDFYVENNKDLIKAFEWSSNSIPRINKPWGISFIQMSCIVILNSISLTLGFYFLFSLGFVLLSLVGLASFVGQIYLWRVLSRS